MKNYIFIVLLFLASCQSSTEKKSISEQNQIKVSLEKVDSVKVQEILATVFLFQGFVNDEYVFRDLVSTEVYRFDKNGELLDQWNKKGDVPGKYSMAAGNFHFDRNENAVLLDIMEGIKILKLDGNVVQDYTIYQNQVSLGAAFSLFDTEQLIEKNGKEYLLYSLDIIEEYDNKYAPDFLKERKNLLLTNLETNETEKFLSFPEGSHYLNGNVYFFKDIRPVFHYDQEAEKLYLMFTSEPILYTFDWSGDQPKLIDEQPLDLKGFELHEGFDPGAVGLGQISNFTMNPYSSAIVNLSKYGENLLITYSSTPQDKAAIARVVAKEASDETKAKLREEAKQKTVLLRPDGEMIYVDFPEMYYTSFKVVGEDIFWMKKPDPDVEAEDFTLYRGKLKFE